MAKLDIYGTSPNCSLFSDWTLTSEPFCNSEFGIVDPDPIELFEDLNDWPPSIFSDIKKIQSDASATSGSINGGDDCQYVDFFEPELKPEIRNIDCMWSAQPSSSSSASSSSMAVSGGVGVGVGCGIGVGAGAGAGKTSTAAAASAAVGKTSAAVAITTAVPLAAVIENAQNISNNKQQQQQQQQHQRVCNNNSNKLPQYLSAADVQMKVETIKEETIDNDYEQQLLQHSIPNNKVQQQQQQRQQQATTQCMQQIKPGMSLLRTSNIQHQKQQQQQQKKQQQNKHNGLIKIPPKTTTEFLRERDQTSVLSPTAATSAATSTSTSAAAAIKLSAARPDTPLSLDDDPVAPEFKHNVDLRACVMGSNNISLVSSDPNNIINHLSEQLQDTSKNRIDLRSLMPDTGCDFADMLDLIVKDDRSTSSSALLNTSSSSSSSSNSNSSGVSSSGFSFGSSSAHNNSNSNNKSRATATATTATHYTHHRSFDSDDDDDADADADADIGDYDDFIEDEEEDEYDDFGSTCGSATSASSSLLNRSACLSNNSSHSTMSSAYVSATSPLSSACSVIGGSGGGGGSGGLGGGGGGGHGQTSYPTILHSDHSYTRCNDDLGTNLETPSDSDEEIDVVSIGDKKLPTNPSDRDRRALQHKVAHKFSNARIVKTANGVRTIPPRRRITVELPYTPASSSPVKSVANSRYPSPSTTPYHNQYTSKYVQQQTQHMITVMSGGGASNGEKLIRKRIALAPPPTIAGISSNTAAAAAAAAGGVTAAATAMAARGGGIGGVGSGSSVSLVDYLPPSKKHRNSKKQQQQQQQQHAYMMMTAVTASASAAAAAAALGSGSVVDEAGGIVKRHYSLDETADTLEKRNLHNDMERQRRIGLKNLFEALKKQIPSIREKERAPKVNILREAAKLCDALTREEQQLNEQKALLKEQLRKKQELLARLRMSMQEED